MNLPESEETRHQTLNEREEASGIIKFIHRFAPSYLLLNKAATARDHLANERTFLSYLRTSLSLVTVGVAIPQIARLPSSDEAAAKHSVVSAQVAGVLFVVLGLFFIMGGCVRYFYAQALMVRGLFPASRGMVVFGSFSLLAILISVFVISII